MPNLELTVFRFIGIFLIGFFYDLVVWSFFAIPVALYCWLIKGSWYRKKWQRIPLFILFFLITLILVVNVDGDFFFGMNLMCVVILSPQQYFKTFKPDFVSGGNTQIADSGSLINEAIAWYQGASYLYRSGWCKRVK